MLSKIQKRVLNTLIDKYEESATFLGKNKVRQSFAVKPEKLYPAYADDAEYDFFTEFNDAMKGLSEYGYVELSAVNGVIGKVVLIQEAVPEICTELSRKPKNALLAELQTMLEKYRTSDDELICAYTKEQLQRISEGKLPEYFDDISEYMDILAALEELTYIRDEVYMRELSVRLYRDSKRLDKLAPKLNSLLFKYGDFPEKETALSECGVISNPSHVMLKGPVTLMIGGAELDLGKMHGDVAFSTEALKDIAHIHVHGKQLITVENLTSFSRQQPGNGTVFVYLGGYHNSVRRAFLKKLYDENMQIRYCHFGDIDAGGFYIYEHLRRKTGIPFYVDRMGVDELETFREYTKELTANDRNRLNRLKDYYADDKTENVQKADILRTIEFMLENNVKLEQEAVA